MMIVHEGFLLFNSTMEEGIADPRPRLWSLDSPYPSNKDLLLAPPELRDGQWAEQGLPIRPVLQKTLDNQKEGRVHHLEDKPREIALIHVGKFKQKKITHTLEIII
jgi:hypothetical protein